MCQKQPKDTHIHTFTNIQLLVQCTMYIDVHYTPELDRYAAME